MQTYNKAYKYRLLPNKEQELLLSKFFGSVRFIWNKILGHAIKHYEEHGKTDFITPAKFKEEFEWLREVDSLALANAQMNLKKAFNSFFSKKAKFPRFKSKKDTKSSYTTNNQQASNAIRIEEARIRLPKLGLVKFLQHRELKPNEIIKTCTISKSPAGKYYISVTIEGLRDIKSIKILDSKVLGLDFSMTSLFVSSEGEKANYPRYFREAEQALHRLCRSVARKKKGSKNRQKSVVKLARFYEYIANLRNNFLHQLSFSLSNKYDAIIIEDLNMQNMSQSLNFGKSVSDNGWGKFATYLKYKLEDRGKSLIKIGKWFPSSKKCSNCGIVKKELNLSDRIYGCLNCSHVQDRDINAAINIRTAGMAEIAW